MDFLVLSHVVEELSKLITGARLERVYQGAGGSLYFILHRSKKNYILLISPDRTLPRMHLVMAKPAAVSTPHAFVLYLRSRLSGTRVTAISLLNSDRVVEIRFSKTSTEYRLIFELTGASANLILADSSSRILSIYYLSALSERGTRALMPGLLYVLPEKKFMQPLGAASPVAGYHAENISASSPNNEADIYYKRLGAQREFTLLRTELSSNIRRELSKTDRRIIALFQDLKSADRAGEFRQAGDLILANLDRLKTGSDRADLLGYDGKTVAVVLDPKLSPTRNADRYFKKYKKAKTGHEIIVRRLREADEEALVLKTLRDHLRNAVDMNDLATIRFELVAGGYIKKKGKEKIHIEPTPSSYRKIVFHSWEILVGKGALGNDYITSKIAHADDLWLHAEGMPGSHVLVKNPHSAADIPVEVLLKAAALAAYYSKGRNADKVSVTYTRAKFVRKPKGAKPGLVMLMERKSIMVKPEGQ
jgi:predicted ribosome quality control (RQC) complex YloA/Tae2 family protein